MFSKIIILLLVLNSASGFASWNMAQKKFTKRLTHSQLKLMVIELVRDGHVFSALPWMKEYMIKDTKILDQRIDSALSKIISKAGIKQFETLPIKYLKRSKSDNVRFIIAKKYLRKESYNDALTYLQRISSNHSMYPYALHMQATIYSILNKTAKAENLFDKCERVSKSLISRDKNSRKLKLNRDYCIVGKARTNYSARKFANSDLLYLDIPKSSAVWPEILFEEAWNSYYQKNYNRTLGKLVSYKAPVFSHMFNPEIEVLRGLTFLKLCLYGDSKKVVKDFYGNYLSDAKDLRRYLLRNRKKSDHFYNSMVTFEKSSGSRNNLHGKLLASIEKEEAYLDLKRQLLSSAKEYNQIRRKRRSGFKQAVVINIQEYILTQKRILGSFVRTRLIYHYATLAKAFEGMSYINLEVLAQKKAKLYSFDKNDRSRGDIKYIERNEKQLFWDFNGEFWADELGDYVFALKSEC
jgi:hypothetical protein